MNPIHPLWLRVACFANSRVQANGHANFAKDELVRLLGKPRNRVDEAIKTAIAYAWLIPGSTRSCLIPDGAFIQNGFGSSKKICGVCKR
ncbi:Uncharacterised protein [Mycobacteroides abscessus subsp. abscessus]|nr:Uncharacterised protein [Mycobacteroides abscessus subsp. abscessus]SIH26339.1 Uncharacterised protein [Mycobacteroides abscessus subsp. abscessus]SIH36010.1 Uncharacterised protein [Mycobacteroides abscessus subsp. abscessus]SII54542.1 Uncharacterised protein [Mycobacteroides abscessus subsp. abscessus]SII72198.1 Uncharacterised protein [Mycobacteroides abscessus subsp. abscessus]